jgi:penicillin V acylase-like amidase (Ntn superfamily)
MTRAASLLIVLLAALFFNEPILDACTTFCARVGDTVLFGRNYDFEIGAGALVINTRGLKKRGIAPGGPAWTATHGSITFNQFGRDFPMGGMNEQGLVVELAWLDVTEYPAADGRAELGVLEWIQYQLDTAATVADVIRSDANVRIAGVAPLHYLVSDASGAAATIEFLGGRQVAHTGDSLPIAVLANTSYEESLRYWRRKGPSALPRGSSSEARFARAASLVSDIGSASVKPVVDRAFAILDNVAQGSTRWTTVYDQTARGVHFRTDTHREVRRP